METQTMTKPLKTPIEKIGDHLLIRINDESHYYLPIGALSFKPCGTHVQICAPGFYSIAEGWTPEELLRVMYPTTSYTTSGLVPGGEA